jgi:CSLREA domain-containing protein
VLGAGLLFALVPVLSARAATFVVTTTADGNNGACTVSLCTLRDAIIAANGNSGQDTITLPAGTYTLTIGGANEDLAATGDLDITDSVIINGAGAATTIVDGGALDRVFDVHGGATLAVFNGITIRNGLTTGPGGGVNSVGSLNFMNCVITGNHASGQGGGIFTVSMAMSNSTVSNNHSSGDQGGGLFLINNGFTILNSTITGNTAADDGGGIYLNGSVSSGSPASLSIVNSTISNNTISAGEGGGMFILSFATVSIQNSTISGNIVDGPAGGGGGILNTGTLFLTNCTVNGNSVTAEANGGGGLLNDGGTATVTSCTIASNASPQSGSNIRNNAGTLTLKNTIVANGLSAGNCSGTITDGGTNLQFPSPICGATITLADPLLQALADNGGPTQTQSLGAGSPAINTASSCPPPTSDQRGVSRPQGSACEIGAFECQTGECVAGIPTNTPTQPGATATPTVTPTTVAASPTQTPTLLAGVVVPTLTPPVLALLGLALAGVALLLLKR